MTLWAPAEVATSTMEESIAPSTGQAKSVRGFTPMIVSTVVAASSVADWRWLSEPVTSLPRWASEARSGSAKGSAITWSPGTASWRSWSHCLATAWPLPGAVVPSGCSTV